MKPGITVMPCASMVCAPEGAVVSWEREVILPPRTAIAPRSMMLPLPSRIRAFVMTRLGAPGSCARPVLPRSTKQIRTRGRFITVILADGGELELAGQKIDDALERIEAERGGHGGPQVRVGVDVVEHAASARGLQVLDA